VEERKKERDWAVEVDEEAVDALRVVCCKRVMLSILADEGLSIGSATHSAESVGS
jgi:hypothetical protein